MNPHHLIPAKPFTAELDLCPVSRWPTTLADPTLDVVGSWPAGMASPPCAGDACSVDMPRTSIIVLTHNGLPFTKLCLESIVANTDYDSYELVIVDNASIDDTPIYLRQFAARHSNVRLVLDDRNRGFAAGNNHGLSLARGDVLILLNNDTIVAPGWLAPLIRRLEEPSVGAAGPVTNRIGNEAQVPSSYRNYGELLEFAAHYTDSHRGQHFEIPMLVMFCFAVRRDVFETIGLLDERFAGAMFEDDDYAMRIRQAGLRLLCVEDSFVHHFGEAAIGNWAKTKEYGERFHANRARWEEKWQRTWVPHRRRADSAYDEMKVRIRATVEANLPLHANVLVATKGDDDLLDLNGRSGQHFPQAADGSYSGFHPANDEDAIDYLESLRHRGAEFLVIPESARWWLDHYREFLRHLRKRYSLVLTEEGVGAVFSLADAVVLQTQSQSQTFMEG
ncbi:MAG TPA: glycosyltransferase family 2 protein [Pirellulales bacterium]|nr:glycosyltransferase family 2 protein [Pirellulales bacterium]